MNAAREPQTVALFNADANRKLVADLKSRGDEIFELPKISTIEIADTGEDFDPREFDWIVLTDVISADLFLEKLAKHDFDLYELDHVRICACGEAVSDRLRFVQVHADVIPPTIDDETVFRALGDYIFSAEEFADLRFLLIKEQSAAPALTEILRARKAVVTESSLYKFEIAEKENLTRLRTLLKGGAVDEFVFLAPTEIDAVKFLLGSDSAQILNDANLFARDEVTMQTLRENGVNGKRLMVNG